MDERPVNLNVERAEKEGDCRLITVPDCLEHVLEESRDGRWTKCLVVLYRNTGRKFLIDTRVAGCSALEARGLMLSKIKEEILDD